MRYGSYANEDGQPEQKWHATVQNDNAIESQRLALRHARAMAAVIRAAKAWQRASARFERSCEADALVSTVAPILQAQLDAEKRLLAATARLVAVEKEVSRG